MTTLYTTRESPQQNEIGLLYSSDGGRTFSGPTTIWPTGWPFNSAPVAFSDGQLFIPFIRTDNVLTKHYASIQFATSNDGGATISKPQEIARWQLWPDEQRRMHSGYTAMDGDPVPQYAVDPSGSFKDRLYLVWSDQRLPQSHIMFSYSTNRGATWSAPAILASDRPVRGSQYQTSIAVNKDGVVLVSWYDRRNAKDNLGWQMRAATSLDGGETFSQSIAVSPNVANPSATALDIRDCCGGTSDQEHSLESMNFSVDPFFVSGGHTSGMAVDSDGTFFPTWLDNHTGIYQLWTAPVSVQGSTLKNGSSDLTDLQDVSKSVNLDLAKPQFDRSTGTLSVVAQLRNTSKDAIVGPLKVRVIDLKSGLGVPQISNSDNGQYGTGAIWDFSSLIPGGKLNSLAHSEPKTLTFHLSGLRSLGQGRDFNPELFLMDSRVYGKVQPAKTAEPKAATTSQ